MKAFAERMKVGLESSFGEKERDAIYQGNAVKLLQKGKSKM